MEILNKVRDQVRLLLSRSSAVPPLTPSQQAFQRSAQIMETSEKRLTERRQAKMDAAPLITDRSVGWGDRDWRRQQIRDAHRQRERGQRAWDRTQRQHRHDAQIDEVRNWISSGESPASPATVENVRRALAAELADSGR